MARPLRQVVEVLPGLGLVYLELDEAGSVRGEDYVEQSGPVRTDLGHSDGGGPGNEKDGGGGGGGARKHQ